MKLSELQRGAISNISAEANNIPAGFTDWTTGNEVQLLFSDSLQEHIVTDGEQSLSIEGCTRRDRALLEAVTARQQPSLCWIAQSKTEGATSHIVFQIHEFAYKQEWNESFPICIDDELIEKVRASRKQRIAVPALLNELQNEFLLPAPQGTDFNRALMSMSPEGRKEGRTIRLFGKSKALDIRLSDKDGVVVAHAYRMVQNRAAQRDEERHPLWLVNADVQFQDKTDAGVSSTIRSDIDALVQSADSYLRVWELYGQMEKRIFEEESEEFGSIAYTNPKQIDEVHWTFNIPHGDDFKVCVSQLRNGQHKDLCISKGENDREIENGGQLRFSAELTNVHELSKTIDLLSHSTESARPDNKGYLRLDMTGDSVRHKRRTDARESIRSAECAMPKLGLILEGRQWKSAYRKKYQKIPKQVLDKFKGQPTKGQIDALRTAMNTPDIALIQGPPGTGKTQVISALLTWLALISDQDITRSTLITSFQHDAVDNVAARSSVYGLPPIRVGARHQTNQSVSPFEIWVEDMRHRIKDKLDKYKTKPIFLALNTLKDIYAVYCVAPGTRNDAAMRVREALETAGEWLSPELSDRGIALLQTLETAAQPRMEKNRNERELMCTAVRGLRVEEISFSDDGPRSCFRLQRRLNETEFLSTEDLEILKEGADWDTDETPEFLPALKLLKERLLDAFSETAVNEIQRREIASVSSLFRDIVDHLQTRCDGAIYGKDAVLFKFGAALERDPLGCENAVEEYAAVLAATVEQSVGRKMGRLMNENECFENVIVDEAARANPLALMIPLSRAERRIILVGDHRQLPHVLEMHIEREVNQSVEVQTTGLLKKSMFERLLEHVKKQKESDGIIRYAMLDKQFRMHPVLAEFVNNSFYKLYDEEFSSGVNAEVFSQEITPYGRSVAVWKRIPFGNGPENRGRSKARPVEAKWVAAEANRLLNAYPHYSIGIISFYSAQVKAIEEALVKNGVMYIDPYTVSIKTVDEFHLTSCTESSPKRERFRVGTVDAFQGKEFDIVILSMTRSNDLPAENEKDLRRKYGHLVLENRLCVGMSRQKRLLIVAGDDAMLRYENAKTAVRGLIQFHELCKGDYGTII